MGEGGGRRRRPTKHWSYLIQKPSELQSHKKVNVLLVFPSLQAFSLKTRIFDPAARLFVVDTPAIYEFDRFT